MLGSGTLTPLRADAGGEMSKQFRFDSDELGTAAVKVRADSAARINRRLHLQLLAADAGFPCARPVTDADTIGPGLVVSAETWGPGGTMPVGGRCSFVTHVHLRAGTTIVPVAESMPREIAAPLSCASATAIAAIDAAASIMDLDGAAMLVTGAGLVGLTVAAAAIDSGARVIVSGPDPDRRANALRFGAIAAVDPMSPAGLPDSFVAMRERLGLSDGWDVSIEASGSSAAVVRGLKTVRGVHNNAPRHCDYPFAELVGTSFPPAELDAAIVEATTGGNVRVGIIP